MNIYWKSQPQMEVMRSGLNKLLTENYHCQLSNTKAALKSKM